MTNFTALLRGRKRAALDAALDAAGIRLKRCAVGSHRAPCPRCDHGPRDDALGLTIDENGGAIWHCFRCEFAGGWSPRDSMPERRERAPKISADRPTESPTLAPRWLDFWNSCEAITPDCVASRYLQNRRCALPPDADAIRWTPQSWHPHERRYFAAMVALITDIRTCEPQSLHFTFIESDGSGKAKIDRPRLYLAGHSKRGGVVKIHADEEVEQGVIIGEGLETCLTAALEFSPIWACLDASGVAAFPVLAGLSGLTVLVDNDKAGREAFAKVRARYQAAGIEVVPIISTQPDADLNDVVMS